MCHLCEFFQTTTGELKALFKTLLVDDAAQHHVPDISSHSEFVKFKNLESAVKSDHKHKHLTALGTRLWFGLLFHVKNCLGSDGVQ